MATIRCIETGIQGATVELQPLIGTVQGAVLHLLPGGVDNPEGFGTSIRDIYATTAVGRGTMRGSHYHPILQELFFTVSGTALWILSDFRTTSPTFKKTVGIITGVDPTDVPNGIPAWFVTRDLVLPRLRVPNGVYHAFTPLTDERVMKIAIGSTGYDKNDYVYPASEDVPGMTNLLAQCGLARATTG